MGSAALSDTGAARSVRDWAIGGVFGNWVQVTDGRMKYARAPHDDNFPLSMWSNRWSTMPVHVKGFNELPKPDSRAWLDRMPGSEIPVIRQPFAPGDFLPFWAYGTKPDEHLLHDLDTDPWQTRDLAGEPGEKEAIDLLRAALDDVEAPAEQYERLGLA